jgi:hypothetical protein
MESILNEEISRGGNDIQAHRQQGDIISFLTKLRGDTQTEGQTEKKIYIISLLLFFKNKESGLKMAEIGRASCRERVYIAV